MQQYPDSAIFVPKQMKWYNLVKVNSELTFQSTITDILPPGISKSKKPNLTYHQYNTCYRENYKPKTSHLDYHHNPPPDTDKVNYLNRVARTLAERQWRPALTPG